jgi:N-acetylglutamate synthase-like GNAT family acetyltransferase
MVMANQNENLVIDFLGIDNDHLVAAKTICDQTLGKDYLHVEELLGAARDREQILLGALLSKSLVGVLLAHPLDEAATLEINADLQILGRNRRLPTVGVALIRTIAIGPRAQHRGIGTALLRHCLEALPQRGFKGAFAFSWLESPAPSSQLFAKAGFNLLAIKERKWSEWCEAEPNHSCPAWAAAPCTCRAAFYYLEQL